jgi:tetratricopeptide (TPR) repeat protein
LCQVYNMPTYTARINSELALARAMSGHVTEALALGDQALQNAQATNLSEIELNRGEVYLLFSRLPEAEAPAARALALFRGQRERGNEAHALCLLADVLWRRDSPDTSGAAQAYHESMALARELGMQPLVARCHLGLGLLQSQHGDTSSARDNLATAAAGFREMAMTAWLGQAEAALARLT